MPDCNNCTKVVNVEPVPYIAHEADMARQERLNKRLALILAFVVALWFATIGIFVWYLNQYDFCGYEYVQDGEGLNIIGDRNGVDWDVTEADG